MDVDQNKSFLFFLLSKNNSLGYFCTFCYLVGINVTGRVHTMLVNFQLHEINIFAETDLQI